jgi:four helix bundle protein
MAFVAEEVSLEMVEALQPLVLLIKRKDPPLSDQLSRAAASVTLNIAESNYSEGGNRRSRLFTAAGSASEVRAALRIAVARRHCSREDIQVTLHLLDRVIAMLWKLTH